jgi:hypothetical protein
MWKPDLQRSAAIILVPRRAGIPSVFDLAALGSSLVIRPRSRRGTL